MINNLVVHVRAEVNCVVISDEQLNIVLEQHKVKTHVRGQTADQTSDKFI